MIKDGEPCEHRGCLSHVTHPCEGCGRTGGRREPETVFFKNGVVTNSRSDERQDYVDVRFEDGTEFQFPRSMFKCEVLFGQPIQFRYIQEHDGSGRGEIIERIDPATPEQMEALERLTAGF